MPSKSTLSVSLTPKLAAFIGNKVESGYYGSASEVVRAGLRALEKEDRRAPSQLGAAPPADLSVPDHSEMGRLTRAYDWSRTSLGPISGWPQCLKTAVGILLRSPVPIVLLWGEDGVMIYNDAYSVIAGGRHPLLFGSKVREGWPEVADFNDNVMKVGLSGSALSYRNQELTLYRKGRPEQVWMNLAYSPVLDESGQPAGVLAIVVETTERIQAERALARAEERLTYALNASGMIGTFDWHIQPDTFYSDARFAAMFSVDPEKGETGAPIADYMAGIHPDDRERIGEAINRSIATGERYVQEYRLLQKDGTIRWIEARGECLYDKEGRPLRFPGAVVDITDRKQAENSLRQLLEALPAAVYMTDAEGRITFYNQAAVDLSGHRPVVGSDQWCVTWKLYWPDGTPLPHDQCPMAMALKEDRPIRGMEAVAERPDGTRVPFIPYPTPLHDASGKLIGAVNMLVDITDLKEAQERQQLLLRELNHRVKNLFAVASGMVALTARSASTPQEMAKALRGRLDALARANDLIRPGIVGDENQHNDTTLESLLRTVLNPYAEEAHGGDRECIILNGPAVPVGHKAVTSLALFLHEAATNAAKYGALSTPNGLIRLDWTKREQNLHLRWEEAGGPPVTPPSNQGFGSILAQRSVTGQLQGEIEYDWRPEGLAVHVTVPLELLAS